MEVSISQKRIDNKIEKSILIGMIISKRVLSEIADIYKPYLIEIPYIRIVANWCIDFWHKYRRVPGKDIEKIFCQRISNSKLNDKQKQLIENLMLNLSEEYENNKHHLNEEHLLDMAFKRFKRKNLEKNANKILDLLDKGKDNEAQNIFDNTKGIYQTDETSFNPFTDDEILHQAFQQSETPLFTFSGAFGEMTNPFWIRDSLVAFQGREKVGKTYWADECCFRAIVNRNNVAHFSTGDLTKPQIAMRKARRVSALPSTKSALEKLLREGIPYKCVYDEDGEGGGIDLDDLEGYKILYRKPKFKSRISYQQARRINHLFYDSRAKGKMYHQWCFGSGSKNVKDLNVYLDRVEQKEGRGFDVIIVDMADTLLAERNLGNKRIEVMENWAGLRRMSQERKALVITTTQSDADSYNVKTQSMANYSECKAKYGFVTATLGINQTDEEKEYGIQRMNWIVLREGDFMINKVVHVLNCLALANPHVYSFVVNKNV